MPKDEGLDYTDPAVQVAILERQRRGMWTPEQIASLAGHFRLAPGMSMLDAGCGFGYSLRTFGPRCLPGGRLVGVDREPSLLDTAARLARDEGLGASATFQVGDIFDLPFDDGTFDAVMVQVVLCHLAEPERALDELIRVTRRGGCVAVFDNASSGGDRGWASTVRATLKQVLTEREVRFVRERGRAKLGRGAWSVGLHVPGWMEARGLLDVDVRVNERAQWMAPPYRSPGQQIAYRNVLEQARDGRFEEIDRRRSAEELRAAGADEALVRRALRASRRRDERWRAAVRDGTAAFSFGGSFWCIWGFRP